MNETVLPISVVIPCYRSADTIERSIDSVCSQTHLPKEIILVDDASDDDTISVILELQNRFNRKYNKNWIRIIRLKNNSGPSASRNAGWEATTQPYIAFLDADDAWHPRKLEIQFGWMQAHPYASITGHKCIVVKSKIQSYELPVKWCVSSIKPIRMLLFSGFFGFPTPSIIVRRDIPFRFEPSKRYSEDYLFKLQITLSGYSIWRLELPLVFLFKARYGENGQSGNMWKMEKGQLDTYCRLRAYKYINSYTAVILCVFSLIKYSLRLLRVQLRKLKQAYVLFIYNYNSGNK
jgi:glycosyltransferase involved in cell wall biosynthesis